MSNNLYMRVPCMPGDTLYRVMPDRRIKEPHKLKISGLFVSEDYIDLLVVHYINDMFDYSARLTEEEIGKSLFYTEDEALEKIKERQNK